MKKFFAVLLIVLLCLVPLFSADEELEQSLDAKIKDGFTFDAYFIGNFIRQSDFAAGMGFSMGLRSNNVEFAGYLNLQNSFNPGGGPYALTMEFFAEPGFNISWNIFRSGRILTELSLDVGVLLDIWSKDGSLKFYVAPWAIMARPMIMTNFQFGSYIMGVGLFYQITGYPSALSNEYNGLGIVLKFV